jgi:hypothetical protein
VQLRFKKVMALWLTHQKNFATDGVILTGIYGNDSTVTFENIEGSGKPQWVSFYYQSMFSLFVCYLEDSKRIIRHR